LTALSWHGVSSQVPRGCVESIGLRRSVRFEAREFIFRYYRIQKSRYFDFVSQKGFFIATPEKAFADTVYLCSLGRYRADFAAMDLQKLDRDGLRLVLKAFPERAQRTAKTLCKI